MQSWKAGFPVKRPEVAITRVMSSCPILWRWTTTEFQKWWWRWIGSFCKVRLPVQETRWCDLEVKAGCWIFSNSAYAAFACCKKLLYFAVPAKKKKYPCIYRGIFAAGQWLLKADTTQRSFLFVSRTLLFQKKKERSFVYKRAQCAAGQCLLKADTPEISFFFLCITDLSSITLLIRPE